MGKFKSYAVGYVAGFVTCLLVYLYVQNIAKTPENCARQVIKAAAPEYNTLSPDQQVGVNMSVTLLCQMANNDYKQALQILEQFKNSH